MSHKYAGPPIGPFDTRTVYADADSTSQTEDGTFANPYKTIQAALNARPAPADAAEANLTWTVICQGIFDEDITVPANGPLKLVGQGDAEISAGRTVTWTTAAPVFTEPSSLTIEDIRIEGTVSASSVAGATTIMDVKNSTIDTMSAAGLFDPAASEFTGVNTFLPTNFHWNGEVTLTDCTCGPVTADSFVNLVRVQAASLTSSAATQTVSMDTVLVVGITSFIGHYSTIRSCTFSGNFSCGPVVAPLSRIEHSLFAGNVSVTDLETMAFCTVGGTLTSSGGSTSAILRGCAFAGLVTVDTGCVLDAAHSSTFTTGITLDAVPTTGIFDCLIGGNFTGPAGSYLVDATTNGLSSPALGGGATLSMISTGAVPGSHAIGGAEHSGSTLAEVNALITDATLIDTGDSRLSDARTPTGAAGGDLGGTYPNPTVNDGADGTAIHDDTAGEILAVTAKTVPSPSDVLLMEDTDAANVKKRITVGNLHLQKTTSVNNAASPYAMLATDEVILADTNAGEVILTLPASAPAGKMVTVMDAGGNAGTNLIGVQPNGADTINGAGAGAAPPYTLEIVVNYGGAVLVSDGSGAWYIISAT